MKKDLLKNKSKELVQLFKAKKFSLRDIVYTLVESVLFNPETEQTTSMKQIRQKKGKDNEG